MPNQDDARVTGTSDGSPIPPQDLKKPWAAYVLGHNSVFSRKWQVLCWGLNSQMGTADGVPLACAEIKEALKILSADVSADLAQEIGEICCELESLTKLPPKVPQGQEWDDRYCCEDTSSPGHAAWKRLVSLVETLDMPVCQWTRLGTAVANFQLDLSIQGKDVTPGKKPSLRNILQCSAKLFQSGWQDPPEVEGLARCYLYKPHMKTREMLASVVDTDERDLGDDPFGLPLLSVLSNQMIELDQNIRRALLAGVTRSRGPGVSPGASAVNQKKVPDTDLQKAILVALDGRTLTKTPLANEVCGGDESRLYKPGGIKELMDDGRVGNERKGNIGYFRPDALPQ